MTKNKMNPRVDVFLERADRWRDEMAKLRAIALACGLTEELKWSKPCYAFNGSNVVIIQEFKEACALLFCKGALLRDSAGLLEKPGENTQGARRIRFTDVRTIAGLERTLKAYIQEAVAAEKAGLEVEYKRNPEPVPVELQARLDAIPALKAAFAALTPGRQRAYILFFSAAKQSATRSARVDKCMPRILRGEGLNDR